MSRQANFADMHGDIEFEPMAVDADPPIAVNDPVEDIPPVHEESDAFMTTLLDVKTLYVTATFCSTKYLHIAAGQNIAEYTREHGMIV